MKLYPVTDKNKCLVKLYARHRDTKKPECTSIVLSGPELTFDGLMAVYSLLQRIEVPKNEKTIRVTLTTEIPIEGKPTKFSTTISAPVEDIQQAKKYILSLLMPEVG